MPSYRLKQFKDVTLHYYSATTLTLQVYVDGGATAARTITFPATSGIRKNHTEPLDIPGLLEGLLVRFRFSSAGAVRLFGGKVRWRPIGVAFDGAEGEVWETQDLGLGV